MDTTIAETYLLLAYDERTGYPAIDHGTFTTALGAAVLLDLVEQGALTIDGEGLSAVVHRTSLHVGDPLDAKVVELADGLGVQTAITQQSSAGSANLDAIRTRTLEHLVDLGALRLERGKMLWVFPTTAWKEADASIEGAGRAALRAAIEADPAHDATIDARTRALVGLASHGGLLQIVLPDLDAKVVHARAKQIAESAAPQDAVSSAVSAAIASATAAISAALFVTTIVPTITS